MTTFKPPRGKTWRYDFWLKRPSDRTSIRYTGNTGQVTKADAEDAEAQIKLKLRRQGAGIDIADRMDTPSFTAWAEHYLRDTTKRGKIQRLDQIERNVGAILLFFGRRPQRPRSAADWPKRWQALMTARLARAPYHDLRLLDPITDPDWVEKFEDWMTAEGYSGPRKNQLRSTASALYRCALRPGLRKLSKVAVNPFLNLDRDDVESRSRTLTPRQLWAWVAHAAPHARIAMAIAAYAPKLRLGVILDLQWREHFDLETRRIVVQRHKARWKKKRPQVVLIPDELRAILVPLRQAHPNATHVVRFRDEPVHAIRTALESAIDRANASLPAAERMRYGAKDGVTFHTIRHTMATMLAELGVSERLREAVMDQTAETIRGYTHLMPSHEQQPMALLAERLDLREAVVVGRVQDRRVERPTKPQKTRRLLLKRRRAINAQ